VRWWVGLRPTDQLMAADLRIRRAQYLWNSLSTSARPLNPEASDGVVAGNVRELKFGAFRVPIGSGMTFDACGSVK